MTYLVLARKWRPRSFDTLVGQEHVVRALTQALTTQRLHHAWLFTGTRGVGKTTLSRILAKALNCEQGITANPCGKCAACMGIDADRYVDYLELDAASNRGVEEMTRLLEQAVYAPSAGRFKVYMIDEVHMLTGHAFNAMLKTLEEPPPHVKFILATTDPQKIPVTVLSRCLQFNLKQMPPESVARHLEQVLAAENVPAEAGALRLIGQAARGSMRDALSLTDQAIAYSGGDVSEEAVRGMLGAIDQRYLVRLLEALVAGDGPGMIAVADELAARSLSYASALGDLASLLAQIAMAQRIPGVPSDDAPLAEDVRRLAGLMSPDAAQLFYSIALHSRPELALAPDEYAGFVMACLRMLAFVSEGGGEAVVAAPAPAPAVAPVSAPALAPASVKVGAGSGPAPAGAAGAGAVASTGAAASAPPAEVQSGPAAARAALAALRAQRGAPARSTAGTGAQAASATPPVSTPAPAVPAPAPASTPSAAAVAASASAAPAASGPAPAPQGAAAARPAAPASSRALDASGAPAAAMPASRAGRPSAPAAPPPWEEDVPASAEPAAFRADAPPWDDYESENPAPPDWEPAAAGPAGAGDEPPWADSKPAAAPPARAAAAPAPAADPVAAPGRAGAGGHGPIVLAEPWHVLATRLPLRGLSAELARQAEWTGIEGNVITFTVPAQPMAQGPSVQRLREALSRHFGQPVQLRMQVGATGSGTAHAVAQSEREERQREAEAAIAADPFVQALVEHFDGQIVPGSIKPIRKTNEDTAT